MVDYLFDHSRISSLFSSFPQQTAERCAQLARYRCLQALRNVSGLTLVLDIEIDILGDILDLHDSSSGSRSADAGQGDWRTHHASQGSGERERELLGSGEGRRVTSPAGGAPVERVRSAQRVEMQQEAELEQILARFKEL